MADNVDITPGTGKTVAADDIGGVLHQRVKLSLGADGAATDLAPGQTTSAASIPVVLASDQSAHPVTISGTPTVSVSGNVEVVNDVGNPLPVSASSLPLPNGAATEATLASIVKVEDAASSGGESGVIVLAVRQDTDAATAGTTGDYSTLQTDEVGRLKVAAQPASIAATTGTITANGQTIPVNVGRASNIVAYCTGTFSTVNCTFEGSLDSTNGTDGNWFAIQAARSNANTVELTTGNLSAAPAYGWELSVNGLAWMRVRATAYTSGTQTWRFQPAPYATEPIPIIQPLPTGSNVIGALTANQSCNVAQINGVTPLMGNGVTGTGSLRVTIASDTTANTNPYVTKRPTPTQSFINSAATTNATSVKASAGTVFGIICSNNGAAVAFVKFYNKASAPTVGTDVPVFWIAVPAGGQAEFNCGAYGHQFGTGIALAITNLVADTDTTAVAASQVKVATSYV